MQTNESQAPLNRLLPSGAVRQICGGVSQATLDRWQARPDLALPKAIKIGQRRYWREADILAWIDAREVAV